MDDDRSQLTRASAQTPEALSPGAMLGSYRIERLLGRGGMGAVFLAHDTTLHRQVAVKVVGGDANDEASRDRLLREARSAAALNHPAICTIYEIGATEGTAFIAMEYVSGRSLHDLQGDGRLPVDEALALGIQAADALAYAHDHGVYRISPAIPSKRYFSDGLTDEMITRLGRLHPQRLSVIARTSSMRYKKRDLPIDQIGRELGVDYVMEGSARREGNRVRISATLIQVSDQTQRWSDSFDRELAGILSLQGDIAGGVARALTLALLSGEQARLGNTRPVNVEAYEAYLKGRFHWQAQSPKDLELSDELFRAGRSEGPELRRGLHRPRHGLGPAL